MTPDTCPTLHAESPIALACTRSMTIGGFDVDDQGRTLVATCGCGHVVASASVESLIESFKAHVRWRRAQ